MWAGVVTTSKMSFLLPTNLQQPGLPDSLTPGFKIAENPPLFFVLFLPAVVAKRGSHLAPTFQTCSSNVQTCPDVSRYFSIVFPRVIFT